MISEGMIKMSELGKLCKAYNNGNGGWLHFIKSITIENIHGWENQEMLFKFPIVAIVGENGIGKSTFLKAAVCAYTNKAGKNFYPSKMFMGTQWDESGLENALIKYTVREGNLDEKKLRWKKTKDWGFAPKKKRPERAVYFLDISRTLPLDATAGYAKIAMSAQSELSDTKLNEDSIKELSYVLGQSYKQGRFIKTEIDNSRDVGLLEKEFGEFSQFHQGAGEDATLDLFKLLQEIPQYSLLVIDEIENSLHPQAQRRLINVLMKYTRKKNLQIILSTHSPYVLEELPPIARIMLQRLSNKKNIVYEMSVNYALNLIDNDIEHPLAYLHVEDECAASLFWAILKNKSDLYDDLVKILSVLPVGSYTVVKNLNDYAMKNKLPYNSVSIVDGDMAEECPACLHFPGGDAPEKVVFSDLKSCNWGKLDERFGIGAGTLFKHLDDAMLLPDHHEWTNFVGDKVRKSKDVVWDIMTDEWCRQCLSDEVANEFVNALKTKIDSFSHV